MKKVIAVFLCTIMALSMAACAEKPDVDSNESAASGSVSNAVSSNTPEDTEMIPIESEAPKGDVIDEDPNQMITPESAAKEDNVPTTQVESVAEGAHFIFQFPEPAGKFDGSVEFWTQNLSTQNIGVVVGYVGPQTQQLFFPDGLPEEKIEKYPELFSAAISDSLRMVKKNEITAEGINSKLMVEQTDKQKTENKMSVVNFTGVYDTDTNHQEAPKYKVAGYCGKLEQSSYPVFVVAIDLSTDQSKADSIGQIALDCISSIEEVKSK